MNPYASNPYMMILKADPDRYINRPAPTVLTLIKVPEGCAAFLWCFRMLDCIGKIVTGKLTQTPAGVLLSLLPWELVRLVPVAAPSGGLLGKVLGGIAAVCVLLELLCLAAEGAAALLLRFFMPETGAKCFRITRRCTFAACVLLAVCVVISVVQQVYALFQNGLQVELTALHPLIVQLVLIVLLAVRIAYHSGALVVMQAVEYEFRLGFKETGMADHRLGLCSFLLGLLFFAAAFELFRLSMARYAVVCALLSLKFFAVWKAGNFSRSATADGLNI